MKPSERFVIMAALALSRISTTKLAIAGGQVSSTPCLVSSRCGA